MLPLSWERSELDITNVHIEDIVPHRGTMLFVHRLIHSDEECVAVEADIHADHVFAGDSGVPSWAGVEYMAQAIAAWAGCRARRNNEPVRIGFLLGTRRYQCTWSQFPFGARLRIEAQREIFADGGMGMFSCRIYAGDEEIAKANISVFEPTDQSSMMELQ